MAKAKSHHAPHLPIWRDAQKLLLWSEQAVRRFARYHKYTVGAQLRSQALVICRLIMRAQGTESAGRAVVVTDIHLAAEEFKLLMQLGKEVQAFYSWGEFEQGLQLAMDVARQSAGWRRALAGAQSKGATATTEREGVSVRRAEVG